MTRLIMFIIYVLFLFGLMYIYWDKTLICEPKVKCDYCFILIIGFALCFTQLIDKYENWINNKN